MTCARSEIYTEMGRDALHHLWFLYPGTVYENIASTEDARNIMYPWVSTYVKPPPVGCGLSIYAHTTVIECLYPGRIQSTGEVSVPAAPKMGYREGFKVQGAYLQVMRTMATDSELLKPYKFEKLCTDIGRLLCSTWVASHNSAVETQIPFDKIIM